MELINANESELPQSRSTPSEYQAIVSRFLEGEINLAEIKHEKKLNSVLSGLRSAIKKLDVKDKVRVLSSESESRIWLKKI